MFFYLFAGAVGFCEACGIYDDIISERGIRAGVAIEAFTWLVGTKPTLLAYYLRDNLLLALISIPALIGGIYHSPLGYAGLVAPIVYGIEHIRGARSWVKLLEKK